MKGDIVQKVSDLKNYVIYYDENEAENEKLITQIQDK